MTANVTDNQENSRPGILRSIGLALWRGITFASTRSNWYCKQGLKISRQIGFKEGEWYLWRAVQLSPRNGVVLNNLGWNLIGQERYEDALLFLEKARRLCPKNESINLNYHVVRKKLDPTPEPVKSLSEQAEENPDQIHLRSGVAMELMQEGKLEEALEHLTFCVEHVGERSISHVHLSWCQFLLGNEKEAVESFRKGEAIDPERAFMEAMRIALQWIELGKNEVACRYVERIKASCPSWYLALASCYSACERQDDYYKVLLEGYQKHPDDLGLRLNMSVESVRRKEYKKAEPLLESLREERPGDSNVATYLAICRFDRNALEEAEELLQSVGIHSQNHGAKEYLLARIRMRQKKKRKALRFLEAAVKANRRYGESAVRQPEFEPLRKSRAFRRIIGN